MDAHNILGIIPARSGSKGVPGKNTRLLNGKPLIHWAAEALMSAKHPAVRICSTDCADIARCVEQTGIEVPWLRPASLAEDTTPTIDVLTHALEQYQQQDIFFSYIALVQATSPTVVADDIDRAITLALEKNADTVISGYQAQHCHPSLMYRLNETQEVNWFQKESQRMSRRQDLSPVFTRTGLIYVIRTDLILENNTIYGDRIFSVEIPDTRSITIDTEFDFNIAELMMEKMNYEQSSPAN